MEDPVHEAPVIDPNLNVNVNKRYCAFFLIANAVFATTWCIYLGWKFDVRIPEENRVPYGQEWADHFKNFTHAFGRGWMKGLNKVCGSDKPKHFTWHNIEICVIVIVTAAFSVWRLQEKAYLLIMKYVTKWNFLKTRVPRFIVVTLLAFLSNVLTQFKSTTPLASIASMFVALVAQTASSYNADYSGFTEGVFAAFTASYNVYLVREMYLHASICFMVMIVTLAAAVSENRPPQQQD